jgi:hypothetical protein
MGSFQTFPPISGTGSIAFGSILSGTNITAIMLVGSGAKLSTSNTGIINANQLQTIPVTANPPTDSYALAYVAANTDLEFLPLPVTIAAVASNFLTSYTSTTGLFTAAQPAFTDISGTATSGQYVVMVGDSGSGGVQGAVPAPPAGSAAAGDFLRADGTWALPSSAAATVPLTAQSAALSGQALFTPSASGLYRVSFVAKVTTPATSSSTLGGTAGFVVSYTDATDSTASVTLQVNAAPAVNSGNALTSAATGSVLINAAASPVSFSYDYLSSGVTAMEYQITTVAELV